MFKRGDVAAAVVFEEEWAGRDGGRGGVRAAVEGGVGFAHRGEF